MHFIPDVSPQEVIARSQACALGGHGIFGSRIFRRKTFRRVTVHREKKPNRT